MLKCGILDKNFNLVTTMTNYSSFIWTDRFFGAGDFELVVPAGPEIYNDIRVGYYISCDYFNNLELKRSENGDVINDESLGEIPLMIVETIEMKSNGENGAEFHITGRSLESILDRRIIWGGKTIKAKDTMGYENYISDAIIDLIGENFGYYMFTKIGSGSLDSGLNMQPTIARRSITSKTVNMETIIDPDSVNRITYGHEIGIEWPKTIDENNNVTSLKYLDTDIELTNDDTVYSAIYETLCKYGVVSLRMFRRFRNFPINYETTIFDDVTMIHPKDSFSIRIMYPNRRFLKASDALIFSEQMGNLKDVNYVESMVDYKNVAYVTSSNETDDSLFEPRIIDHELGMERREMHSQSDVTRSEEDGTERSKGSIANVMLAQGQQDLNDHTKTYVFDGDITDIGNLDYKYDYDIGDIVTLVNTFGDSKDVMISEVTLSSTKDGVDVVPSFETMEDINARQISYKDDTMKSGLFYDGGYLSWDELISKNLVRVENGHLIWIINASDIPQNNQILIIDPSIKEIDQTAIYNKIYEKIIIPDSVITLHDEAIGHCRNLKSLYFSDNTQYLYKRSMAFDTSLESIRLPKNIIYIGEFCFDSIANAFNPDVYIPQTCQYIGVGAFIRCTSALKLYLPEPKGSDDRWVGFYNSSGETFEVDISLPEQMMQIVKSEDRGLKRLNYTPPSS